MAVKVARRTARKASKPKKAKAAVRKTTRRKARKAMKPKAPKAARKARKAKRAKRVTKKMQTGSMRQVWNGTKLYTKSGLMKEDLMINKMNHVMSKKKFASSKKSYKGIQGWVNACSRARAALKIEGFVKINSGPQGIALYKMAKAIYGK